MIHINSSENAMQKPDFGHVRDTLMIELLPGEIEVERVAVAARLLGEVRGRLGIEREITLTFFRRATPDEVDQPDRRARVWTERQAVSFTRWNNEVWLRGDIDVGQGLAWSIAKQMYLIGEHLNAPGGFLVDLTSSQMEAIDAESSAFATDMYGPRPERVGGAGDA